MLIFLHENIQSWNKKLIDILNLILVVIFFLHEFSKYNFLIIFRKTKAIPKKIIIIYLDVRNKELSIVVELIKISVEVLLNIIR